ncbi:MAG: DUF3971 domain-containing protein [Alphaproteobacteria bacterium]|nr:DUF3971 domain-containing protein [Alphaproteobacteria bacterium]
MTDEEVTPEPKRRRGRFLRLLFGVPLLLVAILALAALSLAGRPIAMPDWATTRIETQLNAGLEPGGLRLGRAVVEFASNGVPRVILRNVALRDANGAPTAQLNEVSARLLPGELLRGRIVPSVLRVSGAQITVRRAVDGAFTLSFGGGGGAMGDLPGLLDTIDATFASAPLSQVARIEANDLTITLEDARSGRLWQATGGTLGLRNGEDSIGITVVSEVFNGTEDLAQVQLSFLSTKGSAAASLGIQIENAAAPDIALQAPVLSYLGVLHAPVSGAMRTVIDSAGTLESFAATLEIGQGALQPTPGARAIEFNKGRVYLAYDPVRQQITFSELSVESDALNLVTEGHAYLRDFKGGWPEALLGQIRLSAFELAPDDMFAAPVIIDGGTADFRMRLDPFTVDFGQVTLDKSGTPLRASGTLGADVEGWRVALDLDADGLAPDALMEFWPTGLVPNTRKWITDNVISGTLNDIHAALRLAPGGPPRIGLSYDFSDASVRYLKHMPPVIGGAGHAALIDGRYAMRLDAGEVRSSGAGAVDLAGSSLAIVDIEAKPGRMQLSLQGVGPLPAVLELMNNPPFEVLEKSGRTSDIAQADTRFTAEVGLDLLKRLRTRDVDFSVAGVLSNVTSQSIVPNRLLAAQALDVRVTPDALEVAGPVRLDGLPIDVTWRQPIGERDNRASRVEGTVELSQAFLDTFNIALPADAVSGRAQGALVLDLPEGGPPVFTLQSDLRGVAMRLAGLGWSKPAETGGEFSISGTLGPTPTIDNLRLAAAGLSAEGTVTLSEDGALQSAEFSAVTLGDWLNAPVTLTGRGPGQPPGVAVTGGTIDLRALPPSEAGGEGSSGVPLNLALDRVIVTDDITLSPFRGQVTSSAGLNGTFEARMNGGAPVRGALVPQRGRTAIRLQGDDAGAVIRDAGVFKSFDGGALDLIMVPRSEGSGFDGQLQIRTTRLRDQPVMADLLDAVSIIGIIDQLQGPGILFDNVVAQFEITPDRLILKQGSAVGASLGISLDGTYDLAGKQLDMQGVISPIYLFNAIGQIFTRRGEGLFGFTFRMTGDAETPRVSVNPLSILTPGMFREIFRRAPPGTERSPQRPPRQERREQP